MDRNKRKKIYELLVKVTKPKIFNNNPTKNYQLTLRNIDKINHLPETKEFLFQFLHNVLPTKVRLKRCRANIVDQTANADRTSDADRTADTNGTADADGTADQNCVQPVQGR